MKKSIGLLSISSLLVLFGCGQDESSSAEVNIPEENEDISGDITVWAWELEANYLEQDVLPEFEKEYPNVDVNIQNIGADQIYQRLNSGFYSGGSGLPDVLQIENNRILSFSTEFPDGFTNLSDIGYDKYDDQFPEAKTETLKNENGDYIAMPRDLGPVGVMYRTDIFEEAGVDPESIETWDDYIEAGVTIKEETGVPMLGMYEDNKLRSMIQQQDSYYFNEQGELNIDSKEAERALKTIEEMKNKELINYTNNWDGQVTAMKNGQVATQPDAVWWSGTMIEQMPELSGKWGMFELPAFEEGGVRASNNGGSALTIPSSSDNKEAAYAFSEFATTNVDMQIKGLENRGLFPSLEAAYEEDYFSQEIEYFSNQQYYLKFAETVENIPSINYTSDNLKVRDMMNGQIEALLLDDKPAEQILEEDEIRAERQTGRDIANN